MAMSPRIAACVATLFGMLLTHDASATSCGFESPRRALARDLSDVVFDGTVSKVQRVDAGEVVTFDVRQVWNGTVFNRFTIHNGVPSFHGPGIPLVFPFLEGQRYVVFAHRMTPDERALFGLGDVPEAFGTGMCRDNSQLVDLHVLSELNQLQPGSPRR
jgi:hypothetical protein